LRGELDSNHVNRCAAIENCCYRRFPVPPFLRRIASEQLESCLPAASGDESLTILVNV